MKDSKGYRTTWVGYKLHIDCTDGDIPVSVILTSASLHDSQVAIPLAQMSSERVNSYVKDSHCGRNVRVKGSSKVMAHLILGIIAITSNQLINLLL